MFARKHVESESPEKANLTREQVRAKLLAAGALVTDLQIPDGAEGYLMKNGTDRHIAARYHVIRRNHSRG